jgi:hypothetical protein
MSRFGVCGPDDRLHFAIANLIEPVRLHDVCFWGEPDTPGWRERRE